MLNIDIPGFGALSLQYLLLDFNGTLARDGELLPEMPVLLKAVSSRLSIIVLTGDTYGSAQTQLAGIPCELAVLPATQQAQRKREYVERLGAAATVAIGNGRNDVGMLELAALSIAVMGLEGAAAAAVRHAHIVTGNIHTALTLLIKPQRLVATLRA